MKARRVLKSILIMGTLACLAFTGCEKAEDGNGSIDTQMGSSESKKEITSIIVYSGAGLKNAMEDIKTSFEAENDNVTIEYVYAGAAQLLAQIETSGKGDVLIVGSEAAYKTAKEKGLADEGKLVAHHTPAIAVHKGNPKRIESLADLQQEGLRVALGDSESNAIGHTADKLIEKNSLQDILKNVVTRTATVNEITMTVASGDVDAGIVTEDAVYANEKIDVIEIGKAQNIDQIIPVCSLKQSEQSELAEKFVEFIVSEDGKAIFEKNGFKPLAE